MNFWEEGIFINNDLKETVLKIEKELSLIMTKIFQIELCGDSERQCA